MGCHRPTRCSYLSDCQPYTTSCEKNLLSHEDRSCTCQFAHTHSLLADIMVSLWVTWLSYSCTHSYHCDPDKYNSSPLFCEFVCSFKIQQLKFASTYYTIVTSTILRRKRRGLEFTFMPSENTWNIGFKV